MAVSLTGSCRVVKNLKRIEKAWFPVFLKPQEHVQSGFDDQVYGGSGMIWARMLPPASFDVLATRQRVAHPGKGQSQNHFGALKVVHPSGPRS
jgi:hypothetical protein